MKAVMAAALLCETVMILVMLGKGAPVPATEAHIEQGIAFTAGYIYGVDAATRNPVSLIKPWMNAYRLNAIKVGAYHD